MGDAFQDPQWEPETGGSVEASVLCAFARTHVAAFHVREALHGFSLASLHGQNHRVCALGTLLSKYGLLAHEYHDPGKAYLIARKAVE